MTIGATRQPLRSLVCDELRRLIITGEILPGTRLVEDRLAARLGVSRNPVREALQTLSGEGFVDILPRRGAVVARVSSEQAEEMFDVRMALESLAARLAVRNAGVDQVTELQEVLDRARQATSGSELDLLATLNTQFHQLVVEASGNNYLALMADPMARRVQWVFRASAPTRAQDSWDEHARILKAIADGDGDYAAALAGAHVASARAAYRDLAAAEEASGPPAARPERSP